MLWITDTFWRLTVQDHLRSVVSWLLRKTDKLWQFFYIPRCFTLQDRLLNVTTLWSNANAFLCFTQLNWHNKFNSPFGQIQAYISISAQQRLFVSPVGNRPILPLLDRTVKDYSQIPMSDDGHRHVKGKPISGRKHFLGLFSYTHVYEIHSK